MNKNNFKYLSKFYLKNIICQYTANKDHAIYTNGIILCVISKIIGPSRDRRIISGEEVVLKEIYSGQVSRGVIHGNKKGTENI